MRARGLFLFLLLPLSVAVLAIDVHIEVAPGIEGKLFLPKTKAVPRRAVLLLHGWNADMDEVGNLYADLAEALSMRGIASLRFNFSGEGERANYVVTSTFESRISETEAAFGVLQSRFPTATFGVQGFSLGGLTAIEIAGSHPDWFKTMALWSGAEQMDITSDQAYATAARLAMKNGRAVYRTWTDITLTREFLSSFVGVNVGRNIATYPGSLLTIRGTNDFLPPVDRRWLKDAPTTDKTFVLIGDADHIFSVLDDPKPDYGQRVIEMTVNWFDRTL